MAKCTVYLVDAEDRIIDETEYEDVDAVLPTYFNHQDGHGNRYHVELNGNAPPFRRRQKRLYAHDPETSISGSSGADRPGTRKES